MHFCSKYLQGFPSPAQTGAGGSCWTPPQPASYSLAAESQPTRLPLTLATLAGKAMWSCPSPLPTTANNTHGNECTPSILLACIPEGARHQLPPPPAGIDQPEASTAILYIESIIGWRVNKKKVCKLLRNFSSKATSLHRELSRVHACCTMHTPLEAPRKCWSTQ